jgi:chromosome segregation ATPase
MVNRITELQIASNSESLEIATNAKVALDLEKKLFEQLVALKADTLSTQSLQTQIAELREAKATSDERSGAKDREINNLNEQLGQLQKVENTLTKKLNQVEAQLCEHTDPSDEEFEGTKQELEEAKRKLKTADETKAALGTELDALKESIKLKEGEVNSIIKQKLDSERKVSLFEVLVLQMQRQLI